MRHSILLYYILLKKRWKSYAASGKRAFKYNNLLYIQRIQIK